MQTSWLIHMIVLVVLISFVLPPASRNYGTTSHVQPGQSGLIVSQTPITWIDYK